MKTSLLPLLMFTLFVFGCDAVSDTSQSSSNVKNEDQNNIQPTEGLVNWTALVVRETPSDKGKYITSVYQGEKLKLLGQVQEDSTSKNKNVYAHVELSDGEKGWVLERFLAADAKPAAIVTETEVYKRPDLLTRSDDKFYRMDFVAVKSVSDDWIQVIGVPKGKNWFTEGWIKADKITEDATDISFAVLANRASQEKDEEKKSEEINTLLSSVDFQKSVFYNDYSQQIAGEQSEEQPSEELNAEVADGVEDEDIISEEEI